MSIPSFFSCKRLKALLLGLILCGIRALDRCGWYSTINDGCHALSRCARALKGLFVQVRHDLSASSSPPRDAKAGADGSYDLLCSSLPPEFPVPNHAVTLGSMSGSQEEPTASFIQDASAELDANQSAASTAPQFQPHVRATFEPHPPEPFSAIHPITTSQLIYQRKPIGRDDLLNIDTIYHHPQMVPENAARGYIPSYTLKYTPDAEIPGWKPLLHPQGTMYFHREEKNVVTGADLFDDENVRAVEATIDQLFLKIKHDCVDIPSDTQLVIDVSWAKRKIGYYFTSLQRRCLFWVHEKYVERLFKRASNVRSYIHIGTFYSSAMVVLEVICGVQIRTCDRSGVLVEQAFHKRGDVSQVFNSKRSCYRHHYQLFPHTQILSPQLFREVKGLLSFMAAERVFNDITTLDCSTREVDTVSSIINSIPVEVIENEEYTWPEAAYYHWVVGYIMAFHALHKFDNRHGLPNARWSRGQRFFLDDIDRQRLAGAITLFSRLLSPILFYTPGTYLHSLETIICDGDVFLQAWHSFVIELHQEWNGHIIFATVLLATNMAFLAIPSLDNGDHPENRSAAQISSYLSIVLSIVSIALGQLFSRYHRIKGLEHLDERIMDNFDLLLDVGCSRLAIMYSLPYAMLSWSVIAFLVAFLIMCFDGTTGVVRYLLGVASAVLLLVVVYCIYTMRSNDEERFADSFLTRLHQKLGELFNLRSDPDSHSVELHTHPLSRPPTLEQVSDV